jgi:rhodanese-related sulfurtransferase
VRASHGVDANGVFVRDQDFDPQRDAVRRVRYVSPEELAKKLRSAQPPLIIDVREPEELDSELGRLPGAVNIPLGQLQPRLGELSTQTAKDIVLACRSGRRSEAAAQIIQESGLKRIFVLRGGMIGWREANQ